MLRLLANSSALRPATPRSDGGPPGWLTLRLAARAPFAADEVLLFLGAHATPGLEEWDGTTFSRVLDLPHGLINGVLLPHVIRYNARAAPDRFVGLARSAGLTVGDVPGDEAAEVLAAAGDEDVLAVEGVLRHVQLLLYRCDVSL